MKIAVDAMGGDFAPFEVVKGAIAAAIEMPDVDVILIGDETQIRGAIESSTFPPANLKIFHAPDAIAMDDHPVQSVRRKRQSSLVVAARLVATGEADATFSAGNTGAAMAVATLDIGRIRGVDRPAIATTLPTMTGQVLILDAGANVDCSPENLRQFALLGSVYAERVMKYHSPRVGLLNIGGEESKGNELTKAAHQLLKSTSINFVGNVEGKGIFEHDVDVVVCDGFAGNVLLKASEGIAEFIVELLRSESSHYPEAFAGLNGLIDRTSARLDYQETGGAPLLGINGVSVIGHGRSNARAITTGILAAVAAASSGFVMAAQEVLEVGATV